MLSVPLFHSFQGGDVLQETLSSNITEDVVKLDFQKSDGTVITQFLDFKKEVQIYRIMILNEDEQVSLIQAKL